MDESMMRGGPDYDDRICPFVKGKCLEVQCKFYLNIDGKVCLFELLSSHVREWYDGE